jgi:hypothetical protein
VLSKQRALEEYDNKYESHRRINEEIIKDEESYKNSMYQKERQVQAVSKEKYTNKNKYSETLSKLSKTTKSNTSIILIIYRNH